MIYTLEAVAWLLVGFIAAILVVRLVQRPDRDR